MPGDALSRWLFGKMPSHGDFVSRGLDRDAREALDLWLSAEMAQARADFDGDEEKFDMAWRAAPAWLFVREHGAGWEGGAMAASLDRVGRRFPLLLAAPAADIAAAAGVATGCLGAISLGFEEGYEADRLHEAELAPVEYDWQPQVAEWALVGESKPLERLAGNCPAGLVASMLGKGE